jgi:hypothetical protein
MPNSPDPASRAALRPDVADVADVADSATPKVEARRHRNRGGETRQIGIATEVLTLLTRERGGKAAAQTVDWTTTVSS